MNHHRKDRISRREFLQLGGVSGAALLLAGYRNAMVADDRTASAQPDPRNIANGWSIPTGELLSMPVLARTGTDVPGEDSLILSDGSRFTLRRGTDGSPAACYSRDGGRTWTEPVSLFPAGGRGGNLPEAAGVAWGCGSGKFLGWLHVPGSDTAWLLGGEEADGPGGKMLRWSQPELVQYTDPVQETMHSPDLAESGGRFYLCETRDAITHVHAVPERIPPVLWAQFERAAVAKEGLLLESHLPLPAEFAAPTLPAFGDAALHPAIRRSGFTVEMWLRVNRFDGRTTVLDGRDTEGNGMWVQVNGEERSLEIWLADGDSYACQASAPDSLDSGEWLHTAVVVDGGPRIIRWIMDGKCDDGAACLLPDREHFSAALRDVNAAALWRVNPAFDGEIGVLRVYDRALLTSEVIASRRAQGTGMGRSGFEIRA